MKANKMDVYTVVIIDDEQPARESLKKILELKFPELQTIGEAHSLASGLELLKSAEPDVLFLDINLSDGSGFNLLEQLDKTNFQVVFITAYDKYAIKAFQINALDYIMKPLSIAALEATMKKIRRHKHLVQQEDITVFRKNERIEDFRLKKLVIREFDGIRYITVNTILRCQSHSNYTKIHLISGEEIMTSRTLKEYSKILEGNGFFRIFQSHLVNLSMIKKIINRDGLFVEMENGEILELSRDKKLLLYEEMDRFRI